MVVALEILSLATAVGGMCCLALAVCEPETLFWVLPESNYFVW